MWKLVLKLDPKVVFLFRKTLSKKILPNMVMCRLEFNVQLLLNATPIVMATFDLWMSRGQQDTFTLVVNFLCKSEATSCYNRPF
jgi:hypothetical protein